jgi:hypothetical protein
MERFFFFVILFVMIAPALLSLAFASRHWIAVLWNGFWYMLLGEVAVRAFDTPDAKYLGLAFFVAYIYRALVRPAPSIKFQFQQMNRYGPRPTRPSPQAAPSREAPPSEREVIEAEYKRIDSEVR